MQHCNDKETFIKALNKIKAYTTIVEGKRDKRALEKFGLKSERIVAINGRTLIKVVDEIRASADHDHVIILTDFDKKGRQLASKLMRLFLAYKIHPNSRLRKEFMKFGKTEIEDLAALFGKANEADKELRKGDNHGEISANINKVRNKSEDKGKRNSGKTRHNRSSFWTD